MPWKSAVRGRLILALLAWVFLTEVTCLLAVTKQYLFIGHPRDDGPGQIVQRDLERLDYSRYDLVLLGGDYTFQSTGTRETVAYLDAALNLSSPSTLAALGNHDTTHKDYFTDVTGRPRYYTLQTNNILFVVLDTTDDGQNILGAELQMLQDTVNTLSNCTHLVLVHHHIIWLSGYPPLAYLQGSPLLASSSANLSGLNFFNDVYPLLLQAHSNGVEVVCLAGDRTGSDTEAFYIDHTTVDGVRFIAAGLKEDPPPNLRTAVVMEHDEEAGTLDFSFPRLTDLPRIPDEALVINELHYNPAPGQGDDWSFIELFNRGGVSYDLSGATFSSGVVCTLPTNTVVAPGEYVLVAADAGHYAGLGVQVFDYAGSAKPDSSVPMWLRDRQGLEIDYVKYGVSAPWPSQPDDQGPSLMLIHPGRDNTLATSWASSDQPGGTPGGVNIPSPVPGPLVINGTDVAVSWSGVATGAWYRLESTDALGPPDWRPAGAATQATASSIELTDTNAPDAAQRFFRLSRLFP